MNEPAIRRSAPIRPETPCIRVSAQCWIPRWASQRGGDRQVGDDLEAGEQEDRQGHDEQDEVRKPREGAGAPALRVVPRGL